MKVYCEEFENEGRFTFALILIGYKGEICMKSFQWKII